MIYRFASFEVDDTAFRLSEGGAAVALEPKALRLLLYLVKHPARLVGKQELLDSVWREASVGENALTRSVALLRKTLRDSSRAPQFIETVPTAGYRFVAAVETVETEGYGGGIVAAAAPVPGRAEVPPGASWLSGWRPAGRVGVVLAGLILSLAALGWHEERKLRTPREIHSIAVLPLENLSGNAGEDYFADGTTDELITELARIPNLRVVSRSSAMQEKGSHKPLRQMAEELGADAVVEGSVVRAGDRVRINAQLVDAQGDKHLWSSSFEGSASDIVELEDGVAKEIAAHAKLASLPPHPGGGGSGRAIDPAAHEAYLRGLSYYDRRAAAKSAAYFEQAVEIDPLYSSAYAGLAEALNSEGLVEAAKPAQLLPPAMAAASRAIELDPENGEAYIARGTVQQSFGWDWSAAERDLLHGIELSPNNSSGLMMYAIHLDSMGETEKAIGYMRQARDNDPLSFFTARMYGSVLYYGRHYDEALEQLERLKESQPASARNVIDNWITWIYEKKGMHDEAVAHDLMYVKDSYPGADLAALREEYRRGGWTGYWRMRLEGLHPATASGCGLYDVGLIYVRIGDRDHALASLEEAARQRCFWMSTMRVEPLVDDLRGDPRFEEILRTVHLETKR